MITFLNTHSFFKNEYVGFSNMIDSVNTMTIETHPQPSNCSHQKHNYKLSHSLSLKEEIGNTYEMIRSNSSYNDADSKQSFWQLLDFEYFQCVFHGSGLDSDGLIMLKA